MLSTKQGLLSDDTRSIDVLYFCCLFVNKPFVFDFFVSD